MGGGQLDYRIVHWQRGDAQSDTLWKCDRNCTCPLGSFSVLVSTSPWFLKLIHQSPFLGHVSAYCLCCLNPETANIFQSSPNNTLLEESQYHCADKFRRLVVKYMDKKFVSLR